MRGLPCFALSHVTEKHETFLVSQSYLFPCHRSNSSLSETRLITDGFAAEGLCAQPLIPWESFQSICSCCEGEAVSLPSPSDQLPAAYQGAVGVPEPLC